MTFFSIATISMAWSTKIVKGWSNLDELTRILSSPIPSSTGVIFSAAGSMRSTDDEAWLAWARAIVQQDPLKVALIEGWSMIFAEYERVARRRRKKAADPPGVDDIARSPFLSAMIKDDDQRSNKWSVSQGIGKDVPQYPHVVQFRATGHRGWNPGVGAAIRAQGERLCETVARNEAAFNRAVDEVTETARRLLQSLETASPARNREVEAAKARARARERYA
jgi:hypothetical protein